MGRDSLYVHRLQHGTIHRRPCDGQMLKVDDAAELPFTNGYIDEDLRSLGDSRTGTQRIESVSC